MRMLRIKNPLNKLVIKAAGNGNFYDHYKERSLSIDNFLFFRLSAPPSIIPKNTFCGIEEND